MLQIAQGNWNSIIIEQRIYNNPTSVADINYATRWLKARAKDLKCRPDKVGYIGISSGGHQGVLAAMRPKDPRYAAQPLEGGAAIDARVQCVVAVWPVIRADPSMALPTVTVCPRIESPRNSKRSLWAIPPSTIVVFLVLNYRVFGR